MPQTGAAMSIGQHRPLLLVKLSAPAVPPATVARPRLQERVDGAGQVRLTAVVAPSGWARARCSPRGHAVPPGASGSPGSRSTTPTTPTPTPTPTPLRFWTYALSALDKVAPHRTADALAVLQAPGLDPVGLALSLLLNELSSSEQAHALVLDDYHLVTDPLIQQSVEFLLSQARIRQASTQRAVADGHLYKPLTDRELSILRALRGPLSARDIGAEMYLSINTVKWCTNSLYRRLGVVTRREAVRRGHELGLV